jgi:hypothetical protein
MINKENKKIIINEIKKFWDIQYTNPCYNSSYANDDFLSKIKELEKKYNCKIDPISWNIKEV